MKSISFLFPLFLEMENHWQKTYLNSDLPECPTNIGNSNTPQVTFSPGLFEAWTGAAVTVTPFSSWMQSLWSLLKKTDNNLVDK